MIRSIIYKKQMYIMFLLWFLAGFFGGIGAAAIIFPSLLLLIKNDSYWEAFIGLIFLTILSDSLEERMLFAQTIKGPYLVFLAFLVLIQGKKTIQSILIFSFFSVYFLIAIFCLQYSETFFISLQKTVSYMLLFLIVPNIVLIEYKRRGEEIFYDLIVFIIVMLCISILLVYLFPEVGVSHEIRWRGMMGNPNGLGLLLIVGFLLFEVTKRTYKGLYPLSLQAIFYALIFIFVFKSGSRNAMLSIGLFWLTFAMFSINTMLGILFIITVIPFFNNIYEWLLGLIEIFGFSEELRVDTIESGSGRLIAWKFAWENIQKDTFLLGKGIAYDEYLMRSNFRMLSMMGHEGGVHNTYLIVWLNTGLAGLIAFFTSFIALFARGRLLNALSLPAMFAVMVSINFEPWLQASLNPYTSIFLIMLTVLIYPVFYLTENDEEEKEEVDPHTTDISGLATHN